MSLSNLYLGGLVVGTGPPCLPLKSHLLAEGLGFMFVVFPLLWTMWADFLHLGLAKSKLCNPKHLPLKQEASYYTLNCKDCVTGILASRVTTRCPLCSLSLPHFRHCWVSLGFTECHQGKEIRGGDIVAEVTYGFSL